MVASVSMSRKKAKKKSGFAVMDPQHSRDIQSRGGLTTSRNREHMRQIGAKGGAATHARYKMVKRRNTVCQSN